jgi:hypothetical protein
MKYEVTIKQIEIYRLEIVADSQYEAEKLAWEKFAADKNQYHNDSDSEIECIEED